MSESCAQLLGIFYLVLLSYIASTMRDETRCVYWSVVLRMLECYAAYAGVLCCVCWSVVLPML